MRRSRRTAAAAILALGVTTVMPLIPQAHAEAAGPAALAHIRLYNTTKWDGPAIVELPTGRLASPGRVRWDRVRLLHDGREIPFALREGRPHWKARLAAPVTQPRAEDLLVFSCAVPPGAWFRLDLVEGVPARKPAIARRAGRLAVTYPALRVVVDEATGMLTELKAAGRSLLTGPFQLGFRRVGDGGIEIPAGLFPGFTRPVFKVTAKESAGPPRATLVSSSSNAAMTEMNFRVESGDGLVMALTYRVHAGGMVEIAADERPWRGKTPWIGHAVEYRLPLRGREEPLPYLQTRYPYYGFKDYSAAVRSVAALRRGEDAAVIEIGEETVNGRRWNRRLYPLPADRLARSGDLVEMADEGLIVDVEPVCARLPRAAVQVVHGAGDRVPAEILASALRKAGAEASAAESRPGASRAAVLVHLQVRPRSPGIEGDGYAVQPRTEGAGVVVTAGTRFGLVQAARRMAEHIARPGNQAGNGLRLPLIAGNPAVHLRAGGFGGGDFEVDFPYGTDAEWERAFEGMIDSGMNVVADLSMWSNWKMPVTYIHMPELASNSPDAFDELTGSKFSEIAAHREHGLKLLRFLHERGVRVWQWIPVGAVPTTYAQKHPEAMSPQSDKFPCFTHPLYHRYLSAFVKELLETYPLDGIVMIRDDNGGICPCERCKEHVAKSRTRSPVWEQYLLLYDELRANGFQGEIAVYPYFDVYEPRLDPLLPADLVVVGHGSGAALLSRDYERVGPMGDTWIDNLFGGFRLASTPRMRRLLSDRPAFWIGGAYTGTELPWEAVGRFGWEPTGTVNTFRYDWGTRQFGASGAVAFVRLADAYERLWDLYALPMLPQTWVGLSTEAKRETAREGRERLVQFNRSLEELRSVAGNRAEAGWLPTVKLFGTYFEYHLRRLELFDSMYETVKANRSALATSEGLPTDLRDRLLALNGEIYERAARYDAEAAAVPGNMIARMRAHQMTLPFKEWVVGFDPSLDALLEVKQFAGDLRVSTAEVTAGCPFTLRLELQNTGICPWMPGAGQRIELSGAAERLGLPARWEYEGPPMVFGDRRVIELRGVAPKEPGEGEVQVTFFAPYRNPYAICRETVRLTWK